MAVLDVNRLSVTGSGSSSESLAYELRKRSIGGL